MPKITKLVNDGTNCLQTLLYFHCFPSCLKSFHLWVKTPTSSYLFISIDTISRDPRYLDISAVPATNDSEERKGFFQSFLILCSMFFSRNDLINFLGCALTLMALAAFHTSWRISFLRAFYASEHIHSISLHLHMEGTVGKLVGNEEPRER